MKSSVIAAAAAAVVVSAHEARSPLQLGLNVGNLVNVDLCLGLDVKLPLGISLETDGCPTSAPPTDRTNVWHPPHHIPMDGCDDHQSEDWHYVHPCDCQAEAPHTWGTSTVTATQIKTITSCAPTVTDCPAGGKVTTVIVPATTTVCPVPVVKTTLATVPAKSTPAVTYPADTQVTQAPPTVAKPVTKPVTQAPPAPGTTGASATTPCPDSKTTPAVVVPPVWTKPGTTGTPVVVVPPPVGTGSNPPAGNYTQPPVIAGAAQHSQKIGAVIAIGFVAAFLI